MFSTARRLVEPDRSATPKRPLFLSAEISACPRDSPVRSKRPLGSRWFLGSFHPVPRVRIPRRVRAVVVLTETAQRVCVRDRRDRDRRHARRWEMSRPDHESMGRLRVPRGAKMRSERAPSCESPAGRRVDPGSSRSATTSTTLVHLLKIDVFLKRPLAMDREASLRSTLQSREWNLRSHHRRAFHSDRIAAQATRQGMALRWSPVPCEGIARHRRE